ncbi:helix-turn-helix transcriptional regulator [Fulvivirga sp.]|uniref:helix-turn-helix domain-containing protein n=1 Tax=Fulvivirga sp. TaxID=1931237 RepID=UPI0032EB534B
MKQPHLGKRIADLRQQKNLTQEDLVGKCNINVRTIQRIESGEVTPRPSTLKIIIEALDENFNELFHTEEPTSWWKSLLVVGEDISDKHIKQVIQTAWIAGLIYFALGLVEAAADYLFLEEAFLSTSEQLFYIVTKTGVLVAYFFFMLGFVAVGKAYDNYVLKIGSYLMVATYVIFIAIENYHIISPMDMSLYLYIQTVSALIFGAIGIILAIGFIRLNRSLGSIALVAGVFELMIACLFLTIIGSFIALVLLIPSVIIEVVILFKASELLAKKTATE